MANRGQRHHVLPDLFHIIHEFWHIAAFKTDGCDPQSARIVEKDTGIDTKFDGSEVDVLGDADNLQILGSRSEDICPEDFTNRFPWGYKSQPVHGGFVVCDTSCANTIFPVRKYTKSAISHDTWKMLGSENSNLRRN
jgi:hypothetical protein